MKIWSKIVLARGNSFFGKDPDLDTGIKKNYIFFTIARKDNARNWAISWNLTFFQSYRHGYISFLLIYGPEGDANSSFGWNSIGWLLLVTTGSVVTIFKIPVCCTVLSFFSPTALCYVFLFSNMMRLDEATQTCFSVGFSLLVVTLTADVVVRGHFIITCFLGLPQMYFYL